MWEEEEGGREVGWWGGVCWVLGAGAGGAGVRETRATGATRVIRATGVIG